MKKLAYDQKPLPGTTIPRRNDSCPADSDTIMLLASALLRIVPQFPYSEDEIRNGIMKHGLNGFIDNAGGHAAVLAETAELLTRLGKGENDAD